MEYEDILDRHFAAIIQLSSIEDALVSYAKHIDDTEAEKIKKVTKDIEILRELIDLMLHDTRLLVRQASALKY